MDSKDLAKCSGDEPNMCLQSAFFWFVPGILRSYFPQLSGIHPEPCSDINKLGFNRISGG